MFYYKTNFLKKAVFLEKMRKIIFGRTYRFEGREVSGDKNQYSLFRMQWGFEYFSFNSFFKKNNIFQNNSKKLFFGGMTIFEGMGRRTTKMNVTFFLGYGVPNTVFKFFLQKTTYRLI